MQLIYLTIIFLCYLTYREWQYGRHIADLETKLMAKNAREYVMLKDAERPTEPVEDKPTVEYIDPFDANPDDFLAARGDGL